MKNHTGKSQVLSGAWYYFRPSNPHSGTLWAIYVQILLFVCLFVVHVQFKKCCVSSAFTGPILGPWIFASSSNKIHQWPKNTSFKLLKNLFLLKLWFCNCNQIQPNHNILCKYIHGCFIRHLVQILVLEGVWGVRPFRKYISCQ